MARPEDFHAASNETQDHGTRDTLAQAAFEKPSVSRVGDPRTGYGWSQVGPTGNWPKSGGAEAPGPNGVQWNGNRPDVSRGPGGTIYQPRPDFTHQSVPWDQRRQEAPTIAPIVIPATRDQTGRQVGPTILPDVPASQRTVPSDKGTPGGLVERNGRLVDERSEKEKARAEWDLAGFVGGLFIGMAKGGLRGGIAGGVIGVVVAELTKKLNPFEK